MAGLRVGGIGGGLVLVVATGWVLVLFIIDLNTRVLPYSHGNYSPTFELMVNIVLLGVVFVHNAFGVILGFANGFVGGALAMRRAKRHQAREQRFS